MTGNWIEVPGTKHNHDPENKTKIGQLAHGLIEDGGGQYREVSDSAGEVCVKKRYKPKTQVSNDDGRIIRTV